MISLAAAVPHLGGGGELDVSYVRVALALAACLVVAAAAILLVRHRGGRPFRIAFPQPGTGERRIEVAETRRLGVHGDICLVRHGGREWLLVVQAAGVRVLHEAAETSPCA